MGQDTDAPAHGPPGVASTLGGGAPPRGRLEAKRRPWGTPTARLVAPAGASRLQRYARSLCGSAAQAFIANPASSPLSVPCAPRGGPLGGLWRFRRALLHSGPPRGAAGPQRACSGVCCAPVAAVAGEPPASLTTPAGRSARVEPCSGCAAALALRPRARCALLVRRGAPALAGPPTPAKCRRSSASGGEKGRAGGFAPCRGLSWGRNAPPLAWGAHPAIPQHICCGALLGSPFTPLPSPLAPCGGKGGSAGLTGRIATNAQFMQSCPLRRGRRRALPESRFLLDTRPDRPPHSPPKLNKTYIYFVQ